MKPISYETIRIESLRRKLRERGAAANVRKCRLFAVACCRQDIDAITHPDCLTLLDLAERFADDINVSAQVEKLRRSVYRWGMMQDLTLNEYPPLSRDLRWVAAWGAYQAASDSRLRPVYGFLNEPLYRPLLAEIFGPTGRPPPFPDSWRSEAAVALARAAYESRNFSLLPILADALEEAGCDHPDVLAHCRGPGPHVRGCWVVDAVLGKG